jgi:hypothetical protein
MDGCGRFLRFRICLEVIRSRLREQGKLQKFLDHWCISAPPPFGGARLCEAQPQGLPSDLSLESCCGWSRTPPLRSGGGINMHSSAAVMLEEPEPTNLTRLKSLSSIQAPVDRRTLNGVAAADAAHLALGPRIRNLGKEVQKLQAAPEGYPPGAALTHYLFLATTRWLRKQNAEQQKVSLCGGVGVYGRAD